MLVGTSVARFRACLRQYGTNLGPKIGPRSYPMRRFSENAELVKIELPLWREPNSEGAHPPKNGPGSTCDQRLDKTSRKVCQNIASCRPGGAKEQTFECSWGPKGAPQGHGRLTTRSDPWIIILKLLGRNTRLRARRPRRSAQQQTSNRKHSIIIRPLP